LSTFQYPLPSSTWPTSSPLIMAIAASHLPGPAPGCCQSTVPPVRIAIVGLNFGSGIVRLMLRDLAALFTIVGVCDAEPARAATLAAQCGVPAFQDLDAVLASPSVEAVALFSGPYQRAALIRRIILAGKDVLTTKPFELNAQAAWDVLALARDCGRTIHLNSPTPYPAADVAWIRQLQTQHRLGSPLAMHAQTWADYQELADGSWYDDPARCPVAPMLRLGIYFLNDFLPLLGPVRAVQCTEARLRTGRPTTDQVHALFQHDNGASSSVFASFCVGDGRPYQDEVVLNYAAGTIRRRMVRIPGFDMSRDYAEIVVQSPDCLQTIVTQPGEYAGWYQWAAFHNSVRAGSGPSTQYSEEICAGIRLLDAVAQAAKRRPEVVNL
jgi:predicted dehydrogenase